MVKRMISFIFPAYNESENLKRFPAEVFPEFDKLGVSYEVIVVDDGSADATAAVAESLGDRIRLVRHEKNKGIGAAVRTGIAAARGDLVVTMDTDLTYAPSDVKVLLDRFNQGNVDVVSGSLKLAGYDAHVPLWRLAISSLTGMIYGIVLGKRMTVVTGIFRLYRRSDLLDLPITATGFEINTEILFHLLRRHKRVVEVPTKLTQRIHGESKLNYRKEAKRHLQLIWRMVKMRLSGT